MIRGSPEELGDCLNIGLTEDGDIEISFKDLPVCMAVKEEISGSAEGSREGGDEGRGEIHRWGA